MDKRKTILVVGDVANSIGFDIVCKFINAGFSVKAPEKFTTKIDGNLVGPLSQMDFWSGATVIEENNNFTEIEYDPGNKTKLKELISDCYSVVYLTSNVSEYSGINLKRDDSVTYEPLMSIIDIAKTGGVRQFVWVSFFIMCHNGESLHAKEDVDIKKMTSCHPDYHISFDKYFKKIATDQFEFIKLQAGPSSKCFRWARQGLEMTTIINDTTNKRKTILIGNNKQVRPIRPDNDIMLLNKSRLSEESERFECRIAEFQIKGIFDLCLFYLEHFAFEINEKNRFYRMLYKGILKRFYLGRFLADFLRNPRVPFLGRLKPIGRLFDVSMMMLFLELWPEQVYRFSTRKLLPNKFERYNRHNRPSIPFELIKERSSDIPRSDEINIVLRGSSFDISQIENLNGPIYLINFSNPIEIKRDVIYLEQSIENVHAMLKFGLSVCHVEVHRVAENGETFPPDSYSKLRWYEKLFDNPNMTRIAIAENICRPFKLPLPSSWRPAGAGLNSICALSYFADKINVYGFDFYLESSPDAMSYRKLFSNLYKYKLDVFRSKLHFECALINFFYGYHLSKLDNINIHGYMGQLSRHEKLIQKIERVLFQ
ncbi:conserved hypothetical protein [Candidatus Desulfarcum epimagneticum]|uniref:Uncharacterized protein n=1 Tax=uncultured Desulfobacteraceae bacterium TaxID=218296 RepID=A0A484HH14_9BACT|nr:conserved hypothetical protein [uncultured Desulfobacteraceae bacterium]